MLKQFGNSDNIISIDPSMGALTPEIHNQVKRNDIDIAAKDTFSRRDSCSECITYFKLCVRARQKGDSKREKPDPERTFSPIFADFR